MRKDPKITKFLKNHGNDLGKALSFCLGSKVEAYYMLGGALERAHLEAWHVAAGFPHTSDGFVEYVQSLGTQIEKISQRTIYQHMRNYRKAREWGITLEELKTRGWKYMRFMPDSPSDPCYKRNNKEFYLKKMDELSTQKFEKELQLYRNGHPSSHGSNGHKRTPSYVSMYLSNEKERDWFEEAKKAARPYVSAKDQENNSVLIHTLIEYGQIYLNKYKPKGLRLVS